jgi:hypothetical protein
MWGNNIKMDLGEIGCGVRSSVQDRFQWRASVNMIMKNVVARKAGIFLTSCVILNFQERPSIMK